MRSVFRNVPSTEVSKKIGEYKDLLNIARLDDTLYTVVCFPGMKGHSTSIIDSKTLTKALNKCEPSTDPIIVVAHDFTLEARSIMAEKQIVAIFKSDFGWTDERWAHIRDNY